VNVARTHDFALILRESNALPDSAQALVEGLGWSDADRVIRLLGGTEIYVPARRPAPDHWLSVAVGHDVAQKLAHLAGGEDRFPIPRCHAALLAARDAQIRAAVGEINRDLALRYGLTERRIREIRNRGTPRQVVAPRLWD